MNSLQSIVVTRWKYQFLEYLEYLTLIIVFFYYFPSIAHLILSVYFDKKQELIIAARKKRQQYQQLSNLQAWEDIGSNLDQHNVPQKATNITLIFFAFMFITTIFYSYALFSNSPSTSMYLSMLGDIYVPKYWDDLSMDFLIDGQISSFCLYQPEGKILTLTMLQTHSIFVKL